MSRKSAKSKKQTKLLDIIDAEEMTEDQIEEVCAQDLQEDIAAAADSAISQEEEEIKSGNGDVYSRDSIYMYRHEISRYPLLTPEQEIELARRMHEGDTDAKTQLINSNLRLVYYIVKNHHTDTQVPFMDLIQEGNMGLMKGVERFDYTKGYRLSTYVTCWIKQAINRAEVTQGPTIRIPYHMMENKRKIRRFITSFTQGYGREPTVQEIADWMHVSKKSVERYLDNSTETVSLDRIIGEESQTTLGDLVVHPDYEDMLSVLVERERPEILCKVFEGVLTEKERKIIEIRYGLLDGQQKTLVETSKYFGVTRERIRQIEKEAFKKLLQPYKAQMIHWLLEENDGSDETA